ncbi:MAG: hypothetical protein NT016_03660 [Candidatus Aenigmarchaeota archaeon]|nr:hypothetical protein [Candidatus Aenigmarchaeota archaeon]
MKESDDDTSEFQIQVPAVACDYVAAPMAASEHKHEPGCDLDAANCRGGDPNIAWRRKYSVCTEKGNVCPCYWEKQSRSGFELGCNLYAFHVDRRGIWNWNYMKELLRGMGITR